MDNPLMRAEHEEFRRTVEAEFGALSAELLRVEIEALCSR